MSGGISLSSLSPLRTDGLDCRSRNIELKRKISSPGQCGPKELSAVPGVFYISTVQYGSHLSRASLEPLKGGQYDRRTTFFVLFQLSFSSYVYPVALVLDNTDLERSLHFPVDCIKA